MIKATMGKADADSPDVLLLGLSFENLDRLRAGNPIAFDMAEVDLPPMQVMIFAAPSETAILEQFEKRGMVDDRTIKRGTPTP